MSLSRNGTMEKRDHSERGTPSRAGSGAVVPPPYSPGGSEAAEPPLELRGSLDCWACSVLVTVQNLFIALINASLASVVFGTILTPALTMITFGFLCHSTVLNPLPPPPPNVIKLGFISKPGDSKYGWILLKRWKGDLSITGKIWEHQGIFLTKIWYCLLRF